MGPGPSACILAANHGDKIINFRHPRSRIGGSSCSGARLSVGLVAPGTAFQETVWRALRTIPTGETRSYEWLAREIGRPGAQRAGGHVNGENRIAILIRCHRVVRRDGSLCGYGGGLWRKQFLLDLERGRRGRLSAVSRSRGGHVFLPRADSR
ncbi:MAG: methylated-DNA--[protein]-cysteine S-methyltransferase [Planctomycetes bacterium]|nr:methylated-DNA--[protein]-cysteine S-methyltransferase [Planctomycetota bacterium]